MSSIAPRPFATKSGFQFTVRVAQAEDVAQLIALWQAVAKEARHLLTQPDEIHQEAEAKRSWIQSHLYSPGQIVLLAEAGSDLIGCLSFENGRRRRNAHQGAFGMSVRAEWRRMGVGRALLQSLLDWAEASQPIEKVGLAVFSDNLPAIGLYKMFGFIEEGRQLKHIKMGPNEYQDLILMYRFV